MKIRAEMRRGTRLSPEARKQQLMECAIEVFARRGMRRAAHADIAELANVSVATVFNYFPTREALLYEVLAEVAQFFLQRAQVAYQQGTTPQEACRQYVAQLVEAIYQQPHYTTIGLEWSASLDEPCRTRFHHMMQQIAGVAFQVAAPDSVLWSRFPLPPQEMLWLLHGLSMPLAQLAHGPTPMSQEALLHMARHWTEALLPSP